MKDDDVVEIGDKAVEACDDFINYVNKSFWRRAAALRHGTTLVEARGRAKRRDGHGGFVHRYLLTRRHDIEL